MTGTIFTIAVVIAFGGVLVLCARWLKGHRTRMFNLAVGTLGILQAADYSFLPVQYAGPVMIGIAIVGFWLRELTDTAAGEAE